jgi:predicted DNA-binding protein YlxM (UPF0122 family)
MFGEKLKGYYTTNQAAAKLGITRQAIHDAIRRGEIAPIYYIERMHIIPEAALDDFVENRRRAGITDGRFRIT